MACRAPGEPRQRHRRQGWELAPQEEEGWVPLGQVRGVSWLRPYLGSTGHVGDLSLCPCFFTDAAALFRARRKSRRDSYQPPLASDIERMKATRLKEQKAFALIREILGRQPKLPTRNLLTCLFSTQA